MAIVSWRETSDTVDFSIDQDYVVELNRSFHVLSDAPIMSGVVLYNDFRCPKVFSPHPHYPTALAHRPNIRGSRGGREWFITVFYSSFSENEDEGQRSPNPINRRPIITLSATAQPTKPALYDREGNPIANTAGDRYAGLLKDEFAGTINVTRNYADVPRWITDYLKEGGAVNNDSVTIKNIKYPEDTLKLRGFDHGDYQYENGERFVECRFVIEAKPDGWHLELINEGLREKKYGVLNEGSSGSEQRVLMNTLGPILVGTPLAPTTEPIPLDKDGRAYRIRRAAQSQDLPESTNPVQISGLSQEDILLLKFDLYPALPFKRLVT